MPTETSSNIYAPDAGPHDPAAYDTWFRTKVQAALDDPRPSIPHAQVMADMRRLIAEKAAQRS